MSADKEARRLRKGLRAIAKLPDAECWLEIAREMALLIAEIAREMALLIADEGMTAAAKTAAIDQYDRAHEQGAYDPSAAIQRATAERRVRRAAPDEEKP